MCIKEYLQNENNRQFFENFVRCKFGYGRWEAPYWFVGPEEGGGKDCEELARRVQGWQYCEPNILELKNLYRYNRHIEDNQFHGDKPRRQKTWCDLLSLLGNPNGDPPGWIPTGIRQGWLDAGLRRWERGFQRDYLAQPDKGDLGGKIAFLEVSPLPSPNQGTWLWGCLAAADFQIVDNHSCYGSREEFFGHVFPDNNETRARRRLKKVSDEITQNKPKLVVFYGISGPSVEEAMRETFGINKPNKNEPVSYARVQDTHLLRIYHPNGWRLKGYRQQIQSKMQANGVAPWE
jgi:hypothetical protein